MMDLSEMTSRRPDERVPAGASVAGAGTEPVCVLLRGLGRDARHWGDFPARLSRAWPGERPLLLRPDLPGNGRAHLQTSASRVENMVEPLREQVRAQLGAAGLSGRPLHLLAMSLGAMVAIAWAQRHPDELAGMVLINTSVRPLNPFWQRLQPRAWPVLLRSQLGLMSLPEREAAILALTSRIAADSPGVKALLDDWVGWQQAWPVRHSNALRQLLAAARFHAPEQAPPVPLLLLAGAGDRLVDPVCSRRLARAWQVPLLEHPQAGHDLPLDDPDWVAQQASLFFRSQADSFHDVSACPPDRIRVASLVLREGSDRELHAERSQT